MFSSVATVKHQKVLMLIVSWDKNASEKLDIVYCVSWDL